MTADILVHPKHVNLGLFEHGYHLVVADNLAFIFGILEVVRFDVFPQLLDHLRSRQLSIYCQSGFRLLQISIDVCIPVFLQQALTVYR